MCNDASRALAIACMLLAARSKDQDGTFNGDPEYVKRFGYLNGKPDFNPLIQYGFIEVVQDASNALAPCITEKRREETETETDINARRVNGYPFDFSSWPSIPEHQVLSDWIAMRKRQKANVSQTVVNRFGTELKKAAKRGVSVDDCLTECVTRNWRGFEFAWMEKSGLVNDRQVDNWLNEE